MTGRNIIRTGAAALVLMAASVCCAVSAPVVVNCDATTARWMTVFTNAVTLSWDWEQGLTTGAELAIQGMRGVFTTNFTQPASNYVWEVFGGDAPEEEDVFDLTLTLYTNGNQVAEVHTARLAVLRGAFGTTVVRPEQITAAWSKITDDLVLPYEPAYAVNAGGATYARIVIDKTDGPTQTNTMYDAAGYLGWKLVNSGWGYGDFNLALTFPDTQAEAVTAWLTRPPEGTMIRHQAASRLHEIPSRHQRVTAVWDSA